MKTLIRWGKFNLVGAMGMGLQLAALALFNRWTAGHYLYASAAAVELTLLHNFVWHLHYTWSDRSDSSTHLAQFVRFQLSNGLVSLIGNLALMRLLVHEARLPLLVSNVVAILCCSMANFCLGNNWAFTSKQKSSINPPRPNGGISNMQTKLLSILMACLALSAIASAQTPAIEQTSESTKLPDALSQAPASASAQASASQPVPPSAYHSNPSDTYLYHAGAFCGTGASTSSAATKPTVGCGAGLTLIPLPIFFEVGVMGPQANRSYLSGYISLDSSIPLARTTNRCLPLAIVGYSRLFETGHAMDYGLALALPRFSKKRDDSKSLRIELRDYYTFANPTQHNIMLRVGWMGKAAD